MEKKIAIKIFNELLNELKMNPKQLSEAIGKNRPQWAYDVLNEEKNVGISKNVAELICAKFPQINKSYLLTGEGKMLSDKSKSESVSIIRESVQNGGSNYKMVPLIHIDSVGGMRSKNEIVNEPQYMDQYIPFVNAQEGDIAIIQTGISMTPTIPPGSILQLRKVENWKEYFGYGNIFVIELTDGRRITKEVTRYDSNPSEYIWCVSHNPDVPDEELPKSMIASVWKVIKVLTDKGW